MEPFHFDPAPTPGTGTILPATKLLVTASAQATVLFDFSNMFTFTLPLHLVFPFLVPILSPERGKLKGKGVIVGSARQISEPRS